MALDTLQQVGLKFKSIGLAKQEYEQLQKERKLKNPKCSAIKSSGGRCGMPVAKAGDKCTIHEQVEKRLDGKEVRCKAIKKNGKRCKKSTPNKSGLCYHHD